MARKNEIAESTSAKNRVHTFCSVAPDFQLKLLDDMETLKKAISYTCMSNAADIEELQCAFCKFKASADEKVDAVERGTIVAVERLLAGEEHADSSADY